MEEKVCFKVKNEPRISSKRVLKHQHSWVGFVFSDYIFINSCITAKLLTKGKVWDKVRCRNPLTPPQKSTKCLNFRQEHKCKRCIDAIHRYPSHPGDRITCSPPPSMTQLRGGCLKAVTLTHSSILPNHPPTVPHSRGEWERGRQTEGETANNRGRRKRRRRRRRKRWRRATTKSSRTRTLLVGRIRPNVPAAVCYVA